MVILPKLFSSFNSIPINIPAGFYVCLEIDKLSLRLEWKYKVSKTARII